MFLAAWSWSRSRLKKVPGAGATQEKNQEPLGKKKSGAAKKLAGSSALDFPFLVLSVIHLIRFKRDF